MFTFLPQNTINDLISEHDKDPGKRILQKTLTKEITCMVHSEADYNSALETSNILFSGSLSDLAALNEETFLDVFDGVPQVNINKNDLANSINVIDFLAEKTQVLPSKSEARKLIQGGGISINKTKIESADLIINSSFLINNKYILIQKGKKTYFLCVVI